MKRGKYLIFIASLLLLLAIPLWFNMGHQEPMDRDQPIQQQNRLHQSKAIEEPSSGVSSLAKEQVLADDLSLTTSLLIAQLSSQLNRWSQADLSEETMKQKFAQELAEHPHFHSFAMLKNRQITVSKGNISQEKIDQLLQQEKEVIFSDPYKNGDSQYMLMAIKQGEREWVVGEVNLSFIKKFVGKMASVADANGNFFISAGDTDVEWDSKDQSHRKGAMQSVPELGWKIVVHSDQEDKEKPHYKEGEAIVKFREPIDPELWLAKHPTFKLLKKNGSYLIVKSEQISTEELVKQLRQNEEVESAEPNYTYTKQFAAIIPLRPLADLPLPNDEFFREYQWNLPQIHAEEGWQITAGTQDVIIAILDTGIDQAHEDLAGKIIEGYNAFDESTNVTDQHGHGTHVAGIAAAVTNNVTGIAGVSWHNPIMPVKVLDDNGEGSLFEVASGIRWATDRGAKVINLSLGDTQDSEILSDAIRYAYERDVVLVSAAGNDNVGEPMYPAGYKETLAVAAVDGQRQKAVFSNYGEHIDVTAPGEHIPSTFPNNNYVVMSGTSMASPHVAGFAGLIRSLRPELSNEEVYEIIRQTADDLGAAGRDYYFGYGEINIAAALQPLNREGDISQLISNQAAVGRNWFTSLFEKLRGLRKAKPLFSYPHT